ncbi:MAG: metal-dependent hydrolase [Pseudomonadota bacterium]
MSAYSQPLAPPAGLAALPSAAAIKVRHMDFEFDDAVPEFWYAGDPFRTMALTALSAVFPEGERFFIDVIREHQSQVVDPELRAAIRGFIGQEAHHAKEHTTLNNLMARKGYPMAILGRRAAFGLGLMRRYLSKPRQLATTAALEHFTATLAEYYLSHPEEFRAMDPGIVKIWAWHAVEEYEHKDVAFDVFQATVGNTWLRRSQMALTTLEFALTYCWHFMTLMRRSGHLGDIRMWARGINYFWGRPGVFRRLLPAYFRYYKKTFHPSQGHNQAALAAIKLEYLNEAS